MHEPPNASVISSIKLKPEEGGMLYLEKTFSEDEIEEFAAYVKKEIPDDRSSLETSSKAGDVTEWRYRIS
ncbi:MAG: hypothetical protein IPH20_20240 [Bacteroidales bacterium]|nr:hypothetical protein [Bacteroidales bacterium]